MREKFVGLQNTKPWQAAIVISLAVIMLIFAFLTIQKDWGELSSDSLMIVIIATDIICISIAFFALYLFIPFLWKQK